MITKVYEETDDPVESFTLGEFEGDPYLRVKIDRDDDSILIEPLQGSFWLWLRKGQLKNTMTIDELIDGLNDLKKALEYK